MVNDSTAKDIRALMASIESAGWTYARIELDGLTIVVSDGRTKVETAHESTSDSPPTTAGTPGPPADIPEADSIPEFAQSEATVAANEVIREGIETVISPSIGLFWRSPKPGAPPFVDLGQRVEEDDTVCIIEVMKLMTHVKAGHAGTVTRIHVGNGDTVEFGTPLIDIAPL